MLTWIWLALGVVAGLFALIALAYGFLYFQILYRYMGFLVRVFEERPLFIVPHGQPIEEAEDVRIPTSDGLMLSGCYLRTPCEQRAGVVLFGLEFGSKRWTCLPYCQHLVENGFDVFAFEFRGQGDSDPHEGYMPMQWVTNFEVQDTNAAIEYLKNRSDADPEGIGFFGISKGGSAGLVAGSSDPYVRCLVTDGAFATRTTMIPYMQRYVSVVSTRYWLHKLLPKWFYGLLADAGLRRITRDRGCKFPSIEAAVRKLCPRPFLMINGGKDNYITPEISRTLFREAKEPKEFWLVEGAKHNLSLKVGGDEYREKVLSFFLQHLAGKRTVKELAPVIVHARHAHQPQPAFTVAQIRVPRPN